MATAQPTERHEEIQFRQLLEEAVTKPGSMDAPLITTSLRRSSEPVPGSLSGRNRRDHRSSAYSWRSESIGLSLEARSAGAVPKINPTSTQIPRESRTTLVLRRGFSGE